MQQLFVGARGIQLERTNKEKLQCSWVSPYYMSARMMTSTNAKFPPWLDHTSTVLWGIKKINTHHK
jgi:hypothetical protein